MHLNKFKSRTRYIPMFRIRKLKFDNIFIFTEQHVANPVELLVNIKKNLKQNGKLFIELPLLDKVLDKEKIVKEVFSEISSS